MAARATILHDVLGPKAQCSNRTLTWIVAVITVAILAQVGMKLADKGQFESNKWSSFFESTTWTAYILPGPVSTTIVVVASIVLVLVIGALLDVGRLNPIAPVRWLCSVIVEFFRAIPALMLMLFAYSVFAIWQLFPPDYLGLATVVFGLTMYSGSVIGEMLCSGIESLPKGQREAVIALGLSHRQTMVTILLPQAVVAMLPAIISQMAIALKGSVLGYMIGYVEIARSDRQLGEYYGAMISPLVVVAIILTTVNFGPTNLVEHIESQLRAGRARRNVIAKVLHQHDVGVIIKDETNVDWYVEGHRDLRGTREQNSRITHDPHIHIRSMTHTATPPTETASGFRWAVFLFVYGLALVPIDELLTDGQAPVHRQMNSVATSAGCYCDHALLRSRPGP